MVALAVTTAADAPRSIIGAAIFLVNRGVSSAQTGGLRLMEDIHYLRSDPIIDQQLTFAHHAIEVMLRSVAVLQFQTPAPQLAIALHGTVIELFSGCVTLVECERLSAKVRAIRKQGARQLDQPQRRYLMRA